MHCYLLEDPASVDTTASVSYERNSDKSISCAEICTFFQYFMLRIPYRTL